jgi:predicted RNA-binding protein YlqC (UPF0109 family)
MEDLVRFLAESLVEEAEQVHVSIKETRRETIVKLRVAQPDVGRVVGRNGRVANAMRSLLEVCQHATIESPCCLKLTDRSAHLATPGGLVCCRPVRWELVSSPMPESASSRTQRQAESLASSIVSATRRCECQTATWRSARSWGCSTLPRRNQAGALHGFSRTVRAWRTVLDG